MDKTAISFKQDLGRTGEESSKIWNDNTKNSATIDFHVTSANIPASVFKIANIMSNMLISSSEFDKHENDRRNGSYSKNNRINYDGTKYYDESNQPYFINTIHLQNMYKAPQKMEGFAPRNTGLKVRSRFFPKRPQEVNFHSRNNNSSTMRREISTIKVRDMKNEKKSKSSSKKRDVRSLIKNMKLGELTKQYCSNSSLHGLRYIGDNELTTLEKTFWLIAFVLAVASAGYFIQHLFEKWVESPIIISMSPEPMEFQEFPFPSVTVCNMNNVKKTEADRINKGDNKLEKLLLEDQCDFRNTSMNEDAFGAADWDNVLHFMINVSQPCTDMLSVCQWHGNITDCEKIFNPSMTDEGICCNFNSVHRKYLFFNPREWSDLNITFPYGSIDWNPETGYPKSTPPDAVPWRPYGSGKYFGLTLVLDSDLKEYYCPSTASVGFKMFLHNPVETPKIADFAFTLSPGRETRIIIKPQITTASWSILRVPKKKRKCFFTSEKTLRYYRTYTQKNCLLECEANFTQKICKCVQYYMPKSSNTPICGKKDDLCATTARRAMEQNLYDEEITVNQINITETPSCNCWPGCFEMNYDFAISSTQLAKNIAIDDIYVKKSQEYFAENMAVVHLFFVDSQFPNYVKNEMFGFIEFLSSIGGLLGLFMGFSFLSVAEIVYFVTLRVWCRYRKNHTTHEQSTIHVLPENRNKRIVYPFAQ